MGFFLTVALAAVSYGEDKFPQSEFQSIFNGYDLTGWHGESTMDPRLLAAMPEAERAAKMAEWQADAAQFVDSCDGTVYPATGEGLPQFPVTVTTEGEVSIRLDTIASSDATATDSTATTG